MLFLAVSTTLLYVTTAVLWNRSGAFKTAALIFSPVECIALFVYWWRKGEISSVTGTIIGSAAAALWTNLLAALSDSVVTGLLRERLAQGIMVFTFSQFVVGIIVAVIFCRTRKLSVLGWTVGALMAHLVLSYAIGIVLRHVV
jgi:hypothetical protein